MPKGFYGKILFVDLSKATTEIKTFADDFYRKYMGGGAVGTYFLHKFTAPDTDPLSPENVLTLAPSVTTGAAVSGVSRCCLTGLSPVTNMVADSQSGGDIGPMVKRAGLDAVVISGRADKPVSLLIDQDQISLVSAEHLSGKSVTQVRAIVAEEYGEKGVCLAQCGPAGEKLVRFACVMVDGNDVFGRTGLGAVFGSKNMRAIIVRARGKVPFADRERLKEFNRLAAERLPDAGFPTTLRAHGTPGVVNPQSSGGNLATRNHSRGFHPEHEQLDGTHFEEQIGAGETTCYGCVVRCRKKVKAQKPYPLTEELGGPEFETLGLLGSNLMITDAAAVARASQMCGDYGLDTITMGALAGMVFECCEHKLIPDADLGGHQPAFGKVDELFWLIESVAKRTGLGQVLAEGFDAFIAKYGEAVRPFAIHVKNQGLAVHMAQVKPSLAMMYAACPIGPDHQSSEHDWLLASGSEDCKALGIIGQGDASSTGESKVRMTVYSQIYYSLLDNLGLCQFCFGPGNLFSYRELEDLMQATTGWQTSLWELMIVCERRLAMQRQLNAKRGYDRQHDVLPERLFDPLPDGPSEGACVDRERFPDMLSEFYSMLGWDTHSGNPTPAKLTELGLAWTM